MDTQPIQPLQYETDYHEAKKLIDKLNYEVALAMGIPYKYLEMKENSEMFRALAGYCNIKRPIVKNFLMVI